VTAARIHPGAAIHVWDHLVITLRDEDRETAFLSWYAITWSAALGSGNVALLEVTGRPRELAVTLSDTDGLADRMQRRLRDMGLSRPAIAGPIVEATFERRPFRADGFGVRISAPDLVVDATWSQPTAPMWMLGEGGGFSPTEDIWAAFVEAPSAALVVDDASVPGAPYVDDQWVPKLARALSSAHAAFSEVRVTPSSDRDRQRA
jgi:hypothetical protein